MRENVHSERLECPGCGSSSFTSDPDGNLLCDYCQAPCILPGRACPECGELYEPGARHCPSCGADLVHQCRACGALNPYSAMLCMACGQELDMLDALFARVAGETADWLQQVREQAPAIKAQEEEASQSRLAEMRADEMRRREALAQAQAERDRQQRIIVTVTVAIVALVIVVALISLVMTTR
jgi:RNA polymerase subunit RPABC4/transcription elongation factor Spt4